jgi:pimeloyl-ACP methyl ester carboxylesterase
MPRPVRAVLIAIAVALIVAACTRQGPPPGPIVAEIDGLATEVEDHERFSGTYACPDGTDVEVRGVVARTTRGDDVLLVRPLAEWTGDLVTFAHGYRDPAQRPGFFGEELPGDLDGVLATLGGLENDLTGGVSQALALAVCPVSVSFPLRFEKPSAAFAASSYSATGYAVAEGVPETHLTNPLFEAFFVAPERTFLAGASRGGIVALELAERFPETYDAALPVCGPVGGSRLQLEYVGHVELLFRTLYPDVFDGGSVEAIDLSAPLGLPYGDPDDPAEAAGEDTVVARIAAAVAADDAGLQTMAKVEVEPLGGARRPLLQYDPSRPESLLRSVLDAFYYTAVGKPDVVDRAGGLPFDNRGVTYWLDGAPLESVPVVTGDAAAGAYFGDHYEPTGALSIPTFAVHNLYDPVVPAFHEEVYAGLVADAGRSDRLRTAIVPLGSLPTGSPPFGHCLFPVEIVAAFGLLQDWVATGTPPALSAALEVASRIDGWSFEGPTGEP